MFDSDIGLSAHLEHLLFTLYIRTYVLSFGFVITRVFSFSSSTWYQSHNSSLRRCHHPELSSSFSVHHLHTLQRTLLLIIIFSRHRHQASPSSTMRYRTTHLMMPTFVVPRNIIRTPSTTDDIPFGFYILCSLFSFRF